MQTIQKLILAALLVTFAVGVATAEPPAGCNGEPTDDFRTTDDADYLTGTDGPDVVATGWGSDQYFASDGADTLCGNNGDDVLAGEAGADYLNGGPGDDVLAGLGGPDVITGVGGFDELQGGSGDDRLVAALADEERDDLYDGQGEDSIVGNDEDFWHKCPDEDPDNHEAFTGTVVLEPDC